MNKKNEYVISVATKIIFVAMAFINSILINRYLGPSLKGEYAYIINISNIVGIVIGFNISSSLPYFIKKYGSDVKQQVVNIIYIQLLVYLISGFLLINIFEESVFTIVIILSVFLQFSNQLDFISIIININNRNKIALITSILYTTTLLVTLFNTVEQNISVIIYSLMLYNISRSFLFIFQNKLLPKFNNYKTVSTKKIFQFSFYPMIAALLTTFNYNIDIIILKSFVNNNQIGIYSVGITLASMLWVIPDAFKEVLFSKTAKKDSINQIVMSIKLNLYFSLLIIIGFIFLGKKLILLFYGVEFSASYGVTVILFIGTIPMIFFKIISTIYLSVGKQRFSFVVLLVAVLMNVFFNFLIIPQYGIMGAAFTSVISYFVCGIIMLISFKKIYKVNLESFFIFSKNDLNFLIAVFSKK